MASLGRRRGGAEIWGALGHAAEFGGVLLVSRFPRVTEFLDRSLRDRGLWAGSAENTVSGEIPPLYSRFSREDERFSLHLAFEWETGQAQARATTVLSEAGALMAMRGTVSPAQLAAGLGGTAGAARSYLNWMTDAGLARRAASGFALRHPALGALFEEALRPQGGQPREVTIPAPAARLQGGVAFATVPPPRSERQESSGPRWDPSELD